MGKRNRGVRFKDQEFHTSLTLFTLVFSGEKYLLKAKCDKRGGLLALLNGATLN